ncbi:uncharacterized protein DNG_10269 [Cephalotrichum gorgonifer]|uniref:Polyketide cyclase n=1 Tax=Cephalotrichum gorgonifer TaxID=2041049 RepID=A0AAE8T024_9PEZI|nr:uncharacterized protein DNG_10269 [Cephalotrichum gorgonifer]
MESQTVTCFVRRTPHDLYEMFWKPQSFPLWASGLASASLERDSTGWKAQGPEGPIRITFTEHNALGVMDHWVDLGEEGVVYIPLRIVANGEGSEVMLTLFRQPEMDSEQYARDVDWVRKDLGVLKALAEGEGQESEPEKRDV